MGDSSAFWAFLGPVPASNLPPPTFSTPAIWRPSSQEGSHVGPRASSQQASFTSSPGLGLARPHFLRGSSGALKPHSPSQSSLPPKLRSPPLEASAGSFFPGPRHPAAPVMAATYASVQKRGHPPAPACDPAEEEPEGAVYSTVKPRALRGGPATPTEYTVVAHPGSAALESPACSSPGSGRPLLSSVVAPSTTRKASTPSRNCPGPEAYEDVTDIAVPGLGPGGLQPSGGLGFNIRIGKPKGPRDPPAEWSRV
ncbi:tyrosine-protein phosphatase non-receptor type 18 [Sarcophilus harrisii]|uniref:tyrosine-protein phosphatase non-receptor type 18 n=1 Tax=Sarcophilus harrisii TaxID=9305 RepID=UPI001301ACFA|nr:tyrosine-protein phosphatase non-receptor type 18 [Sarcophilus harrisii]